METVEDMDLLGDRVLRSRMLWLSGALAVGCVVVLALAVIVARLPLERVGIGWLLAAPILSAVSLAVHELVHAALFRALGGPGCRVFFGCKDFMLYTRTNDLVLTRDRELVALLGPTVLVNLAIVVGAALASMPLLGTLVLLVHLPGCSGDLLMCHEIMRACGVTHVRDTESGVSLLRQTG